MNNGNSHSNTELNQLLEDSRERLRRMIKLRMDRRLAGRVDESDIIQEAYAEAAHRFEKFQQDSEPCSPFIWLRFLALQKLAQAHRHHIKVQARSVLKEQKGRHSNMPPMTSAVMAFEFVGNKISPLDAIMVEEARRQVTEALDALKEVDREILAMRHFEQMSNKEVAEALDIPLDTAYKRYIRALTRLKGELGERSVSIPGF